MSIAYHCRICYSIFDCHHSSIFIVFSQSITSSIIMDSFERKLRFQVFQFFLDNCRPPTVQDLSSKLSIPNEDVSRGLKRLRDLHHVKLYADGVPSPAPIAMAHPFSRL